jgi:hypothetical protein
MWAKDQNTDIPMHFLFGERYLAIRLALYANRVKIGGSKYNASVSSNVSLQAPLGALSVRSYHAGDITSWPTPEG